MPHLLDVAVEVEVVFPYRQVPRQHPRLLAMKEEVDELIHTNHHTATLQPLKVFDIQPLDPKPPVQGSVMVRVFNSQAKGSGVDSFRHP